MAIAIFSLGTKALIMMPKARPASPSRRMIATKMKKLLAPGLSPTIQYTMELKSRVDTMRIGVSANILLM